MAHEIWPGHHLLNLLALSPLHPLLRGLNTTGFGEGWATYAEVLVAEQVGGAIAVDGVRHVAQLALLARVDVGLHAHGWSTHEARDTLRAGAGYGHHDADATIETILSAPGRQASYYIGYVVIRGMQAEAAAINDRSALRAFHDRILKYGPLPLGVLRSQAAKWETGSSETSPGESNE